MKVECANGQLFTCNSCKKIHLEFLSTAIDFDNLDALSEFNSYLNEINFDYFEKRNKNNNYRRKIIIPFPGSPIKLMLTSGEANELAKLVKSFRIEYTEAQKRIAGKSLKSSKELPSINLN